MLFTVTRRSGLFLALLLVLFVLPLAGTASANGAVRLVVIDEVAGPYLLRVGVLPADPTVGAAACQHSDTGRQRRYGG